MFYQYKSKPVTKSKKPTPKPKTVEVKPNILYTKNNLLTKGTENTQKHIAGKHDPEPQVWKQWII